jgi:hypothetical protein
MISVKFSKRSFNRAGGSGSTELQSVRLNRAADLPAWGRQLDDRQAYNWLGLKNCFDVSHRARCGSPTKRMDKPRDTQFSYDLLRF